MLQSQDSPDDQRNLVRDQPSEAIILPDILRHAAAQIGTAGGISGEGVDVSYADLEVMSERLAGGLLAAGVGRGDRVLVLLPNSLEFIVSCFAVWKMGGILVAEDPAISDENLGCIAKDCTPSALIFDRGMAERLKVLGEALKNFKVGYTKDRTLALRHYDELRVESLDAVLKNPAETSLAGLLAASPGDVASLTYTSGTTGRPKGVMHTHESWLAGASFTRDYHQLTGRDSSLIPLPPHHGLAFRQILACVLTGARIVLASDIYLAIKMLREKRPTAAVLVPAGVNILLDRFSTALQEASPSLRYMEVGSAPLAPERFNQLRRLMPSTLIHLPYGLTEARVGFLKAGADGALNRIAKLSPNLDLQLIDEQGAAVPPGQVGEILLKGPGLMKGYWGQSEKDIAALKSTGFRTGDMGMVDERGDVALLGRRDDMLKVGGHKVNPAEIEALLRRHGAVQECAVVAVTDPAGVFEAKLHAFVVPASHGAALSEMELRDYCRGGLESYKVPDKFHFQNSLPKSSMGKILKQALKTMAASASAPPPKT